MEGGVFFSVPGVWPRQHPHHPFSSSPPGGMLRVCHGRGDPRGGGCGGGEESGVLHASPSRCCATVVPAATPTAATFAVDCPWARKGTSRWGVECPFDTGWGRGVVGGGNQNAPRRHPRRRLHRRQNPPQQKRRQGGREVDRGNAFFCHFHGRPYRTFPLAVVFFFFSSSSSSLSSCPQGVDHVLVQAGDPTVSLAASRGPLGFLFPLVWGGRDK